MQKKRTNIEWFINKNLKKKNYNLGGLELLIIQKKKTN